MYKKLFIFAITITVISSLSAYSNTEPEKLRIGVVYSPPYLINDDGNLSGVCIDLWRLVSDTMNIRYDVIFYQNHDSLLHALRNGNIDLSICPNTATTERLRDFRLTIPFYISNMGIVSRLEGHRPLLQVVKHLFSWTVIRWLLSVLIIVSVFASFLWLAERRGNSAQFHPGLKGVLDGVWWAFVTMTTVGYGDKIPKTNIGKILAITWMFFAISLFFVASGVISSELTLNKLEARIHSSHDLTHCRVGAVENSGYAETLNRQQINFKSYKTTEEGFAAIKSDSIDAFVFDMALLNYVVDRYDKQKELVVIPSGLNLQYFSFMASKENLALIDNINPALLSIIDGDAWEEILAHYGLNK
jgi:polar amino acid transport system substrate-binding protein